MERLFSLRNCQMKGRRKHNTRVNGFATNLRITGNSGRFPMVHPIPHSPKIMRMNERQQHKKL